MPIYNFRCRKCGRILEVAHGYDEPHPKTCPKLTERTVWRANDFHAYAFSPLMIEAIPVTKLEPCGGELERIFPSPNIVFKGSGFYSVDKRLTPVKPIDYNPAED